MKIQPYSEVSVINPENVTRIRNLIDRGDVKADFMKSVVFNKDNGRKCGYIYVTKESVCAGSATIHEIEKAFDDSEFFKEVISNDYAIWISSIEVQVTIYWEVEGYNKTVKKSFFQKIKDCFDKFSCE